MADTSPSTTRLTARAIIERLSQESSVITGLNLGPGTAFARLLQRSDQSCILIATDPAVERGAVGLAEVRQCLSALSFARQKGLPVIWLLDTSGIRVTEGVDGIAALRCLVRCVVGLRLDGTKMLAVGLGNVFGGMSIIAALSEACVVHKDTLIAVSGPRLIDAGDHDAMFKADDRTQVQGLIGGLTRARLSPRVINVQPDPATISAQISDWLPEPAQNLSFAELRRSEEALAARLPSMEDSEHAGSEAVHCGFPDQHSALPLDRLLLTLRNPLGATAADCLRISRDLRVAATMSRPPRSITIHLDTPCHSSAPADEKQHLGEFLAQVALAVSLTVRAGISVDLVVVGDGGGAILGALGGPATSVAMKPDALLHVLSPAALTALRSKTSIRPCTLTEALLSGAADIQHPQSERHHVGE